MKTLIVCLACLTAQPAQAQQMFWPYDNPPTVSRQYHAKPKKVSKPKAVKPKRKHVAKKAAPKSEPTKVLAAEYRHEQVMRCIQPVRVVGSQDVRESAAEDSARKAWAEAVRWASGEAYMDVENAKDYQRRCSRSSIGEIAGQVFTRCEIIATPCRPGMTEGSAK